jgi:Flp pilus assembly protein TadD
MLAGIAWTRNDLPAMERELELTRSGGQQGEFAVSGMRITLAECHGQLKQARLLEAKFEEMARQANFKETAAGGRSQQAVWEAAFGFHSQAIESVNLALKDAHSPSVVINGSYALVLAGEEDRALKLASDLAAQRPYDTLVQYVFVPLIKAMVALNHKQPAKAIDLLDGAMVYARINPGVLFARGLAYLQAKQGKEAAEAFQKILDLRAVNTADPLSSMAELGLGRAYALQGDMAHSRVSYQNFFALWKDADPDILLLREAKAEYAKVQ